MRKEVDSLRSTTKKRSADIRNLQTAVINARKGLKKASTRLEYASNLFNYEVLRQDLKDKVSLQIGEISKMKGYFQAYRNTPDYKAKDAYRKQRSAERKAVYESKKNVTPVAA